MSQTSQPRLFRTLYPGINARVTGPFLLIIIVVAAIGVFIVTRLVAGSLQERFNNQLLDSARAASNAIVDIERQQIATLRLMVFTDGVPDAIAEHRTEDLDLWLRPVAANASMDDVIIFDGTGQSILRLTRFDRTSLAYSASPPPDIAGWPGVQRVLGLSQDTQGDKFVDVAGESPEIMFYVTAPVKDSDEHIIGAITVGMRTERLAEQISAQALSAVMLYDANGTLLGSTFRLVSRDLLALPPDHLRELLSEVQNTSPLEEREFNGEPYHLMYTTFDLRSESIGLMAVALPTNFIVERIGTSRDQFAVLFAGLFVVVGALGLLTARTITQPVHRLVETTSAIRGGDLSKRVGLRTPDELGQLAISFDHMTNQLIERNAEIEELYLQQLEETAQRDAVLSSIGDAVMVQDPQGKTLLHNESAAHLMRTTRSDPMLHQNFMRLIRQPETLAYASTVELGGIYYSVLATPVLLPSGRLLGHVIVFRDISALLNAEKLKDDLILQMSHELRTPLTAARGYVDLVKALEQQRLSAQGEGFVGNALDHLTILERMINQVVDVSAIISNRFTIAVRPFNLAALLDRCVTDWHEATAKRDLMLSLSLPSDEMWIEGDETYLTQVFDHLIRNAYSYTLPGGAIEVYAAIKDGHAQIHVSDNGVGIPPNEIDLVFERMYRGSSADAGPTDARGLGLGLYFSKHIVEAHHGIILLESKLDFGTVVTVDLPVRQDSNG